MTITDTPLSDTLFISDLDGTLLDKNAALPEGYVERLNALTDRGVRITYATARTVRSVSRILHGVNIPIPMALMNGVLVRDMQQGEYVHSAALPTDSLPQILEAFSREGIEPFLYTIDTDDILDGDPLKTYYRAITTPPMRAFMEERVVRYKKPFLQIDDMSKACGEPIYICAIGDGDKIRAINDRVRTLHDLNTACYKDSYDDVWYLEVFSALASKKHAVEFLKKYTHARRIVCFGDNLNDLPMFEAADVSVAVENAADPVKKIADHVTDDVVGFIEDYIRLYE